MGEPGPDFPAKNVRVWRGRLREGSGVRGTGVLTCGTPGPFLNVLQIQHRIAEEVIQFGG